MALLPVWIGLGVSAVLVPGLVWMCGKRKCSRKPWRWVLLFFCCVMGFWGMKGYQRDGLGREALRVADGKRVWVSGTVAGIREKEKSYEVALEGCRMLRKIECGQGDDSGTKSGGGKAGGGSGNDGVWEKDRNGQKLEPEIRLQQKSRSGQGLQEELADITCELPNMMVYVEREKFEKVNAGETVRLGMEVAAWGELSEFSEARNPGEFDFREYNRALGIHLQMFGEDFAVRGRKYWGYRDFVYRLRLAAGDVLAEICEPEDLGIFQAAILGDKTVLDETVRALYQRNGIAHLLAISGLHISMVGMFVYRMLRRGGMGYGSAGVIGAVVIVSYGVLTGGSSSVVRAVMMLLLFILGGYLGRSYDMMSAAGLACILLLLKYPGLLMQAGFQLSFGAVMAIGGLGPWMIGRLELKNGFGKNVMMGAAIQIVTCPVIVYHFYQYPVYGIVLNLVVIPLMGYVVVSGILGILLGAVWRPAGIVAIGSGHYILEFYQWLCLQFEKLPGANLVVGRPRIWQMGVYAVLMTLLLCYVCRSVKCGVRRCILFACGTVFCFLILRPIPIKGLDVTFLDVGQGDGICIRSDKAVILVDGGSSDKKELGKNTLEPYLKSLGITNISYAVVSHGDNDHISAIRYLLEQNSDIHIQNLILPWLGKDDDAYEPLVRLMKSHGGQVHWMQTGECIRSGDLALTCLYHGNPLRKQDRNEHSLVLSLTYGQTSMLLTGDMSEHGEQDMITDNALPPSAIPVQVLKAAHHGSKYSNSAPFLNLLTPTCTVISCGAGNSYGHPHQETMDRLSEQKTKVLITQDTGAIMMHTDGEELSYTTFLTGLQ